jgi:hypothetical protein
MLTFFYGIRMMKGFIMKTKVIMEVNMTLAIKMICVVAGTALLGRSGDMFPTLQGNA